MANRLLGALGSPLVAGFREGVSSNAQELVAAMQQLEAQKQSIAEQKQREQLMAQKQSQAQLENNLKIWDALTKAGMTPEAKQGLKRKLIDPHIDNVLDHIEDPDSIDQAINILRQSSKLGAENTYKALEVMGLTNVRPPEIEMPEQMAGTQPGMEQPQLAQGLEFEREAAKTPFAQIDPSKYTPASIRKFEQSRSYADLIPSEDAMQSSIKGKNRFDAEKDLRKEYVTISKVFSDVRDSFARVQESAKQPSAAGDLSLIFNFMKMLDPGSVVRESEFANAQTAQPLLERLGISFDAVGRIWEGEKLSESARLDFVNRSKQLMDRQKAQQEVRNKSFSDIAKRNKLDVRNVVISLDDPLVKEELPPDITEEDIAETMRANNMTRQQVLERLQRGR